VMSRSNMVCKAKSLKLFAGITPASFCHRSISDLAPLSFFSCSCLFVKFSLSVFILPVSPPLRVFLYEVPPHKTTSFMQPSRPQAYTSDPLSQQLSTNVRASCGCLRIGISAGLFNF
jgi:hypothetical protein